MIQLIINVKLFVFLSTNESGQVIIREILTEWFRATTTIASNDSSEEDEETDLKKTRTARD